MRGTFFNTFDEYLAAVNELLATASPLGAYNLALAEVFRRNSGKLPPLPMLEMLVACGTLKDGAEVYAAWCEFAGGGKEE